MSLRKYHNVILAANEAVVYTIFLRLHRKFILTAILLKFLQINIKIMYIKKIEK